MPKQHKTQSYTLLCWVDSLIKVVRISCPNSRLAAEAAQSLIAKMNPTDDDDPRWQVLDGWVPVEEVYQPVKEKSHAH